MKKPTWKNITQEQVESMIRMKFGALVRSADHPSYVSNQALGKMLRVSASHVRHLYMRYFDELER
jgi:hypothetical protein